MPFPLLNCLFVSIMFTKNQNEISSRPEVPEQKGFHHFVLINEMARNKCKGVVEKERKGNTTIWNGIKTKRKGKITVSVCRGIHSKYMIPSEICN